jgi:hypothetical protein
MENMSNKLSKAIIKSTEYNTFVNSNFAHKPALVQEDSTLWVVVGNHLYKSSDSGFSWAVKSYGKSGTSGVDHAGNLYQQVNGRNTMPCVELTAYNRASQPRILIQAGGGDPDGTSATDFSHIEWQYLVDDDLYSDYKPYLTANKSAVATILNDVESPDVYYNDTASGVFSGYFTVAAEAGAADTYAANDLLSWHWDGLLKESTYDYLPRFSAICDNYSETDGDVCYIEAQDVYSGTINGIIECTVSGGTTYLTHNPIVSLTHADDRVGCIAADKDNSGNVGIVYYIARTGGSIDTIRYGLKNAGAWTFADIPEASLGGSSVMSQESPVDIIACRSGFILMYPRCNASGKQRLYCNTLTPPATNYPLAQNGTYVKATSTLSSSYYPYYATDPTKSVVGAIAGNCWLGTLGTGQRFHIDLGSAKIVTKIYYENHHEAGTSTTVGVKDFTFWGSNSASAFAELTYGTDTGWTQLTTDPTAWVEHAAAEQADPQYVTVTNTTAYRYYAIKIATNWGHSVTGFRRVELQTAISVGAAKEVSTLDSSKNIWGGYFFRPKAYDQNLKVTKKIFYDINKPGDIRVAYSTSHPETLNTYAVETELLSANAYPDSTTVSDTGTYQDFINNVDCSGSYTSRYIRAFERFGTECSFHKYEPNPSGYINDQSSYNSPVNYTARIFIDPQTYNFPLRDLSVDAQTEYIEQDIRTIYVSPNFYMNRNFYVTSGNIIKRTVWTVDFAGNSYEISQIVPKFVDNNICYYQANAYVIGPSRDPFSREVLQSET